MSNSSKPEMSRRLLGRMIRNDKSSRPNGKVVGPAAPASFRDRVAKDRNRQAIGRYSDSILGKRYGVRRVSSEFSSSRPTSTDGDEFERLETGQNRPSAGFKEPEGRKYDPYA